MLTVPLRTEYFCERRRIKDFRNHDEYLARIEKSLYYVYLPKAYCTSLPCTELAAEIFSEINRFSIDKLGVEEAANLSHNACVSPCSLVLALLYLDRLKSINPKYLKKVSPSELFLISLMVGSKFLQDDGEEDEVNNYEWAASAGINVQDINKAEKQFLDAINWKIFVSEKEFWDRFHVLECKLGLRQGCKRGWFTYTELHLLLEFINITAIIQTFCTVTAAFLMSYTASVLTLLGSALLVGQIPGLGLKSEVQDLNKYNWSDVPSFNFTTNFPVEPNTEDCTDISSPVMLYNLQTSDSLNFGQNFGNFNDMQISDCINADPLQLFLKLSSVRSSDVSYSRVTDFNREDRASAFENYGKGWRWADIITNYLLMNSVSVPNNLFPIMDL